MAMAPPKANARPRRTVPMRVIVCGVQRTGTLSMRHALYQLGFHDCHHMHTVRDNVEEQAPHWIRALEAKSAGDDPPGKEEWDEVLGDCQAICDVPGALFGCEIAEAYPDAKVIILNRDPDKWYESVLNSIHSERPALAKLQMMFCALFDSTTRMWIRFGMAMHKHAFGYDHRSEKGKALAWFKKTYDNFHERIPADRRIDYAVGDGWGPLCDFLEVPVPKVSDDKGRSVEAPFPRLNDRAYFKQEMVEWRSKAIARSFDNIFKLIGKLTLTGSTAYVGYLMWKTRLGGRV